MLATLLSNWKLVVIATLVAALGGMTNLYLGKRDALSAFTAQVEQAARDAREEKERVEKQHAVNLEQVRKDHEAKVPEIRAGAVANYLARHRVPKSDADRNPLPGDGPGIRLDDGAERQCVPDTAFIENAAEDVEKLATWQDWCKRNNCPVEDSPL